MRVKIRLIPNVRSARSLLKTFPRTLLNTSSQNLGCHNPTSPFLRRAGFTPPFLNPIGGGGVNPALPMAIENRALIAPHRPE